MARGDHRPAWQRLVRQTAGWSLLVLAAIAALIPVLPHTPFLVAGVLLLAPYVRVFRRLSAWLHRRFPRWRGPMRRFRDFKQSPRAAGGESPCKPAPADAASVVNDPGEPSRGPRT
jgi:hypothetical protein